MSSVVAATDAWKGVFRDDITVKVKVELDVETSDVILGPPSTIAAALNAFEEHEYTAVAAAMGADAISPADSAALALLQPGPYLEALTHDTSPGAVLGPGGSPEIRIGALALGTTGPKATAKWNSHLRVSRANSKALGLPITSDGLPDIRLVVNDASIPLIDVDRGDGILPGDFDFLAIAAHEIGHGMGFISGVDHVDFVGVGGMPPAPAPGYPEDLSDEAVFSVLDLFRTNLDTRPPLIPLGQPATGFVLDWRFGPPSGPDPKPFFSLDGTEIDPLMKTPFATGAELGDGNQAGHWAETIVPLGVMAADFGPGIFVDISPIDVLAFDVIGWDLVPEPSSAALMMCGLLGFARGQRPRRS